MILQFKRDSFIRPNVLVACTATPVAQLLDRGWRVLSPKPRGRALAGCVSPPTGPWRATPGSDSFHVVDSLFGIGLQDGLITQTGLA
jgi:hypothetical protein